MKCPYCFKAQSHVVDSRQSDDGTMIRRRRECDACTRRFTTYERVETIPVIVIKKDKTRQSFDANKLRNGIIKSCEKRPVPLQQVEELVNMIEGKITNLPDAEVTSQQIGEMVMEGLKKIDEVAYVRFASVYRQFRDIQSFRDELNKLLSELNP